MRTQFLIGSAVAVLLVLILGFTRPGLFWLYILVLPLVAVGVHDLSLIHI